jgi:16S rRNA (guanine(966)-N(2))-methyltransferase RsmD
MPPSKVNGGRDFCNDAKPSAALRNRSKRVYVSTRNAPVADRRRAVRGTPSHKVRIIGGRFKRTPLPVADAPGLRPTPDRVRETLFNWLAHLRPNFASLRGLDLFAGTGALGFELASRGAAAVTLVERAPALAAQLRATRDKLGAANVEVIVGDALAVAARLPRAGFDLVFLDPPFDAGLHAPALAAVAPLLAAGALVYVEAAAPMDQAAAAAGLAPLRSLKAGLVCAQLFERAHLPAPADH